MWIKLVAHLHFTPTGAFYKICQDVSVNILARSSRRSHDAGKEGLDCNVRSFQRCLKGFKVRALCGPALHQVLSHQTHPTMTLDLVLCTGEQLYWNRKGPSPNSFKDGYTIIQNVMVCGKCCCGEYLNFCNLPCAVLFYLKWTILRKLSENTATTQASHI